MQVKAGVLRIDDCNFAASQFMMTCQASLFLPFIFQASPVPSPERIEAVVDSAGRMFLAAYRASSMDRTTRPCRYVFVARSDWMPRCARIVGWRLLEPTLGIRPATRSA